ncbi:MAG: hypothetical protein Q4D42_03980 [Eubacteriales bacterium]|nr:hypothetical protein [Eubacteriales bacterium]
MSEEKKKNKEKEHCEALEAADQKLQRSRKIFVFYIIGLFCVALGLILVSYVMQEHANQQLADLGSQLTVQTDAAEGAEAKADQLQEMMDTVKQQLEESQKTTDELNTTVETQQKSIDALEQLWKLERAYRIGDDDTAAEIVRQMDEAYTRETLIDEEAEPLTGDAAKEYDLISSSLD